MRVLTAHVRGDAKGPVPEAAEPVWRAFVALSNARALPNPISFVEIEAYARLHRMPLKPHHVELIMHLDQVFRTRQSEPQKPKPAGDLTPEVFDAVTG